MLQSTHSGRAQRVANEWFAKSALNANADAYVQYLTERGYAARTIEGYFRSAAHFAHYSGEQRISLSNIDEGLIDRFLNGHLPGCRCALRCWRSPTMARAALGHLLAMLRASEQCAPQPTRNSTAITVELENFDSHLTDVCGLAPVTRSIRMRHQEHFLVDSFGNELVQLSALGVADVHRFMAHYTAEWVPGSIRVVNTSLRSYF